MKEAISTKNTTINKALLYLGYTDATQQQAFIDLLKIFDIGITNKSFTIEGKIQEIDDICQKLFLRQSTERQQIQENPLFEQNRELITKSLVTLGFIDEVAPKKTEYDALFVFGASQQAFMNRLNQLDNYLTDKIITKIDKIYLLGGQRALWPYVEYEDNGKKINSGEPISIDFIAKRLYKNNNTITLDDYKKQIKEVFNKHLSFNIVKANGDEIINIRTTIMKDPLFENIKWPVEIDMMYYLAKKACNNNLSVMAVDTPLQENGRRPNTLDTINQWKKDYAQNHPLKSNILAISNQPFINYQKQPLLNVLSSDYDIEVVGTKTDKDSLKLGVVLDSVARSVNLAKERAINQIVKLNKDTSQMYQGI